MAEFNAELVDGTPENHQRLALQITEFVDFDYTDPRLPDDRDAWLSDLAIRTLERDAGHHKGNWAWLADVCRRAAAIITSPSGKALLLLEQFGGGRRTIPPDESMLEELRKRAETLIGALPEGSRKDRLMDLFNFQVSVYARDVVGDYLLAMELQVKIEERAVAKGDLVAAAIASLCAAWERLNHAISKFERTSELLVPLHLAAYRVTSVCSGDDPTQRIWRCYNAPQHVLLGNVWTLSEIPTVDESFFRRLMFDVLPVVDQGHYLKNLPTIWSIEAGLLLLHNQREEARRIASRVVAMGDEARLIARTTASLILAILAGDEYLRYIAEAKGETLQLSRLATAILMSRGVKVYCFEHAK